MPRYNQFKAENKKINGSHTQINEMQLKLRKMRYNRFKIVIIYVCVGT